MSAATTSSISRPTSARPQSSSSRPSSATSNVGLTEEEEGDEDGDEENDDDGANNNDNDDDDENDQKKPREPQTLAELLHEEDMASKMLTFVLERVFAHHHTVSTLLAACTSSIDAAIDVVPVMVNIVEEAVKIGVKEGVFIAKQKEDDGDGDHDGVVEGAAALENDRETEEKKGGEGNVGTAEETKEAEAPVPSYDHIPVTFDAFLAVCRSFSKRNPDGPVYNQLLLLEKTLVPFKSSEPVVAFK